MTPETSQAICQEYIIFHTFRDQNLEIYLLQGVEGTADAKLVNLSSPAR
jgi:hypothetical protein